MTIEFIQMREEERKLLAQLCEVRGRMIAHLDFWNDAFRKDAIEAEHSQEALAEAVEKALLPQLPIAVSDPHDTMTIVRAAEAQLKLNRVWIDDLKARLTAERLLNSSGGML